MMKWELTVSAWIPSWICVGSSLHWLCVLLVTCLACWTRSVLIINQEVFLNSLLLHNNPVGRCMLSDRNYSLGKSSLQGILLLCLWNQTITLELWTFQLPKNFYFLQEIKAVAAVLREKHFTHRNCKPFSGMCRAFRQDMVCVCVPLTNMSHQGGNLDEGWEYRCLVTHECTSEPGSLKRSYSEVLQSAITNAWKHGIYPFMLFYGEHFLLLTELPFTLLSEFLLSITTWSIWY